MKYINMAIMKEVKKTYWYTSPTRNPNPWCEYTTIRMATGTTTDDKTIKYSIGEK